MRDQKKLTYIIQRFLKTEEWPSLLGIIANWENETLNITFFFEKRITENLKENASVLATEILAQYPDGFLKEDYVQADPSQPLPNSSFWVYKRADLMKMDL